MDVLEFLKFSVLEEHKSLLKLLDDINDQVLNIELDEKGDTIGKRFSHISSAEFNMAGYLYKKPNEEKFELETITTVELKSALEKSKTRHLETLDNLVPTDLEKLWTSPRSGREFTYKWLVYHFLEHIATHRGQIAMAIRQAKSD